MTAVKVVSAFPAQQAIELGELAALALPPHPSPVCRASHAAAVKEDVTVITGPFPLRVEPGDALAGQSQESSSSSCRSTALSQMVGQEREVHVGVEIRQRSDLPAPPAARVRYPADRAGPAPPPGSCSLGDALLEGHLRQCSRRQNGDYEAIDDRHRHFACG